jgi:hypothetical protein
MKLGNLLRVFLACFGFALASAPLSMRACAACFGQSDSPLAEGMNMGILALLVVVVFVLGGIASFFVYLAKKSAAVSSMAAAPPPQPATQTTD